MKDTRLVWLITILLAIFLILAIIHNRVVLKSVSKELSQNQSGRLQLLGEMILPQIEEHLEEALNDPFYIYALANDREGVRIVLMDRNGVVRMDSHGGVRRGLRMEQIDMNRSELTKILDGTPKKTMPYQDDTGTTIQSLLLPYDDSGGAVVGIAGISIEIPSMGRTGEAAIMSILLKVFGTVIVIVVFYVVIRSLRVSQRNDPQAMGKTGAMVETFHNLVRELKEKERELEMLRNQAEQHAADIESYNENILQSVASGVITFDQDRLVTTFNPAAERILRILRRDAIGKTCGELFGQDGHIDQLLREALTRGIAISRREFELKRKGQERIWVGVSTSLLNDREKVIIGATFVFTDLTEIKYLQEQIELKRRLTVLGEMSAGIAHEFRNFMGTIMGFAKLIAKRSDADDPRQKMVQAIIEELQAMNQLIEQLLSFGRHAELNLRPVDLDLFLNKQILQVLEQSSNQTRPKLSVDIPADMPLVTLDEVLMRQAITNIFQNALDAMPEGGELRVKVGILNRGIPIRGAVREVFIEIEDTGIGISKDKLDKIFLPFFTAKEKGTGMGLALAHKVILSHNGRIEVDTMEGQGTTFRICLPLK